METWVPHNQLHPLDAVSRVKQFIRNNQSINSASSIFSCSFLGLIFNTNSSPLAPFFFRMRCCNINPHAFVCCNKECSSHPRDGLSMLHKIRMSPILDWHIHPASHQHQHHQHHHHQLYRPAYSWRCDIGWVPISLSFGSLLPGWQFLHEMENAKALARGALGTGS